MKEVKLEPDKAVELGFLDESTQGQDVYLLDGKPTVIEPEDDFVIKLFSEEFRYEIAGE